jgi:hypothetical protein
MVATGKLSNLSAVEGNRMGPTTTFSLCLLAVSTVLIWTHLRAWKSIQAAEPDESERQFGRGQFRRRATASSVIGMIGIALLASPRIMDPTRFSFWLYWVGLLLAVMAIAILAIIDLISTRLYYRRLHHSGLVEQAVLKAKLKRLQAHRRNGDHR